MTVLVGVPQGSYISPLLYTNDIPNFKSSVTLFAYDILFLSANKNYIGAINLLLKPSGQSVTLVQ